VENLIIKELTGEQRRQFIDTQQVYEAWLNADEERQRRFTGSMRWGDRNGVDYLLRKIRQAETSLGPRSEQTEKAFTAFVEGRERNKDLLVGLAARLDVLARVNVAMRLGRVPVIAARILRRCAETGLLGRQLFVVGTNSLFAYETLAGVQFAGDITATGDIDLLYDSRRRISFVTAEKISQSGLIGLLRKVDQSFKPLQPRGFRATNRDGYLVDLIRPLGKNALADKASTSITSIPDDLDGAPVEGLQWLINAPKVDSIAIDERGYPVKLETVDPRVFAVHKAWLAKQPGRPALKSARDRDQSVAVAHIARQYLGLSLDSEYLAKIPALLREAAVSILSLDEVAPIAEATSIKPDW
jgi:hypothetical protein